MNAGARRPGDPALWLRQSHRMASDNAAMPAACNRIDDGAAPLQLGRGGDGC